MATEFIGFAKSQQPAKVAGMKVSNHDELMCNFFSQPDALAIGRTLAEVKGEGAVRPHKVFEGNRPSTSLLFLGELDARACGMLLAVYEHRTAVEGFLWEINSFDQWGVELGKELAKAVRLACEAGTGLAGNSGTGALFDCYLKHR